MKKLLPFLMSMFLVVGMVGTASAVSISVYTNKAAWEAAVGGSYLTEDFNDDTLNAGLSIDFDWVGSDVSNEYGYLYDRIDDNAATSTTFNFVPDTYSFGGDWDLTENGSGVGIKLTTVGGETVVVGQEISKYSEFGFFGIVSDTAFSSVRLSEGTQSGQYETYQLDNLVYNTAAAPVPEPGTILLLGTGLLGFVRSRKRKKC